MFKLVKIFNSGANVAEPYYLPTDPFQNYKAGSFVGFGDDKVTNICEMDPPSFLVGETAEIGEKKRLLCYPVNESMVFETEAGTGYKDHKIGMRIGLGMQEGIAYVAGTQSNNGPLCILDTLGASSPTDPILVTLVIERY